MAWDLYRRHSRRIRRKSYTDANIVAIANIKGPGSPKTNVARSGIEATQERDEMLRKIYRIYKNHVADEVRYLRDLRSYSLTWAIEEARYLIATLLKNPTSKKLLEKELIDLEVLPVEKNSDRIAMCARDLTNEKFFWTIECMLLQPAEVLIREAATSTSLVKVVKALNLPNFDLPSEMVLCGIRPSSPFGRFAYQNREIDKIVLSREQRRIDLRWTNKTSPRRWISYTRAFPEVLSDLLQPNGRSNFDLKDMVVGVADIDVPGDVGPAIRTLDNLFIMPGTEIAKHLIKKINQVTDSCGLETQIVTLFHLYIIQRCFTHGAKLAEPDRFVSNSVNRWESYIGRTTDLKQVGELSELVDLVSQTSWATFAPSQWSRKWQDN